MILNVAWLRNSTKSSALKKVTFEMFKLNKLYNYNDFS